jgi:enoyl-CoA hydratase/carnithine racemase
MDAGGFSRIKCDVPRPHVARILMASGPFNPLDADVCAELYGALGFVHQTPEIRALVLGHEGPYFCSGGEVPSVPVGPGQTIGPLAEVLKALHALGKPSIAAIDGKAHGSGLALAMATDLAVAGPGASLFVPEPAAGLWSFHVLAELVPIIGRRAAAEIFLDGHAVNGTRAHSLGLVNHVVVDGTAMDDALARAVRYAELDPAAVALGLPALRRADLLDPGVHDWLQGQLDAFLATPSIQAKLAARAEAPEAPSVTPAS